MEFVTQLWAYQSKDFLLGISFPELLRNHIWLVLIVVKTSLVGCSAIALTNPDLFTSFFALQSVGQQSSGLQGDGSSIFYGPDGKASLKFTPACYEDKHLQTQLVNYYYWQAAILTLLAVTYMRILLSDAQSYRQKRGKTDGKVTSALPFDDGAASAIEFTNNTIKIRKEDPLKKRNEIILKSWNGLLLACCSVLSALVSLFSLLPALFSSSCHTKHTWSMSKYPGASFAIVETLLSLACLGLLCLAAVLMTCLDYVPRFFLRTVPQRYRVTSRRFNEYWHPEYKWKPTKYTVDLLEGVPQEGNSHEYDCSQVLGVGTEFKNMSRIDRGADQSTIFLNDSRIVGQDNLNLSLLTKLV